MPLYGLRLMALMGDEANRPDVCQGIRQFPTPFSIAVMIWDVTRAYTSVDVAVFSFTDIVKINLSRCSGIVPDSQSVAVPSSFLAFGS